MYKPNVVKNPGKVRARTYGTKSPSRSEALRFIDSAKSPSTKIDGSLVNFRHRLSNRHGRQHPPWSPVSIGKPVPKIHQWTIYFCRWGFGWVDKAQCFRSARRFGAVGSSPDFSRVFHDIWLVGIKICLLFSCFSTYPDFVSSPLIVGKE